MDGGIVVAFVRLPVIGKVKTRLARGVGPAAALQLYQTCADAVLRQAGRLGNKLLLFYSRSDRLVAF